MQSFRTHAVCILSCGRIPISMNVQQNIMRLYNRKNEINKKITTASQENMLGI